MSLTITYVINNDIYVINNKLLYSQLAVYIILYSNISIVDGVHLSSDVTDGPCQVLHAMQLD